jgi:uncharacterized protein (DUF2236 family)
MTAKLSSLTDSPATDTPPGKKPSGKTPVEFPLLPISEADGSPVLGVRDYIDEAYVFLGAGAAVALQMAMPGVGHGVSEHSQVLTRPLSRLRTTMSFIYATTLGSEEELREIVRVTNRAHVPVRSETYNAFDPELQMWVASTLYRVGVQLMEFFHGKLGPYSKERLYRESMIYGTALQVKPEMWPRTVAGFEEYWQQKLKELTADDQVRHFIDTLYSVRNAPWFAKPLMPLNRFVTTGLLPQEIRDAFGLEWNDRKQRNFDRFFRVVPAVYKFIPRIIRTLPTRLYMYDMKRRIRSGRGLAH